MSAAEELTGHASGDRRPAGSPRWWELAAEHEIHCPHGHHIPQTAEIMEHGFIRCPRWVGADRRGAHGHECGAWVYLMVIPGGDVVVAEVALHEKKILKLLKTPAAVLRYLGIFPRRRR